MQRQTEDGATQKMPPGGLSTETAQGDAKPKAMMLSASCFIVYACSFEYFNRFDLLVHCISVCVVDGEKVSASLSVKQKFDLFA